MTTDTTPIAPEEPSLETLLVAVRTRGGMLIQARQAADTITAFHVANDAAAAAQDAYTQTAKAIDDAHASLVASIKDLEAALEALE